MELFSQATFAPRYSPMRESVVSTVLQCFERGHRHGNVGRDAFGGSLGQAGGHNGAPVSLRVQGSDLGGRLAGRDGFWHAEPDQDMHDRRQTAAELDHHRSQTGIGADVLLGGIVVLAQQEAPGALPGIAESPSLCHLVGQGFAPSIHRFGPVAACADALYSLQCVMSVLERVISSVEKAQLRLEHQSKPQ
jgi:hypothetical protein